eukprot:scaffold5062_cov227-Chaetoceros_neogracile.AAC.1
MLGRSDEKFKVKILMKYAQDIDDWASIHISIHPIGSNEGFAFDTVSGFLLAGVGHRTADSTNFLIVKTDTKIQQVEEAFLNFSERDDVGIILINQHIASDIRHVLKDYNQTIPTVLEIPSKEHPYDPEQDYIMQRVNMYLGGGN